MTGSMSHAAIATIARRQRRAFVIDVLFTSITAVSLMLSAVSVL